MDWCDSDFQDAIEQMLSRVMAKEEPPRTPDLHRVKRQAALLSRSIVAEKSVASLAGGPWPRRSASDSETTLHCI